MKVVFLGVAGSNNAFSLSLYNLKAFALSDPDVRSKCTIKVIQHPLIQPTNYKQKLDELFQTIIEEEPDLLGLSCYMWNINFFKDLASCVQTFDPKIKILFGGPEMTTDYIANGSYNSFHIDFCVSGEGELTCLELLRKLAFGKPTLKDIRGLSYRTSDKKHFVVNPKRIAFKSLNEMPSPYLEGVVDQDLLTRGGVEASIETQRGCSLRCSFCIYHKDMNRIAYNDIEKTNKEVQYVVDRGVKYIRFVDANFSSKLDHAKEIMRRLIAKNFELKLMLELIPGFIDDELASLFAEFNNNRDWNDITLGVGVQSVNIDSLRLMRRAIKIDKFERTFELIKKYRIYAKIDLIIGLPGEDIHAIERTLEYMMDTLRGSQDNLLCCHVLRGLPGTELLEIAKKYDVEFTSQYTPHEIYSSSLLPREDLLKCQRRTAVIFRLVNHEGWANREFIYSQKRLLKGAGNITEIHDAYFLTRDQLGISNMALIDLMIEGLKNDLRSTSDFVKEDFPCAETWWWIKSKREISNSWILKFLSELRLNN